MTFDLPDVNVWLALEVKSHALHAAAATWFRQRGETVAAFCRVTQMAFLRLLTNKAVMGNSVQSPEEAWQTYRTMTASSETAWLPEPYGIEERWEKLCAQTGGGGGWWTDAYLSAFAIGHGARLVTFDRDFRRFEPAGLNLLLLTA